MRWMFRCSVSLTCTKRLLLQPLSLRGEKARFARHWRACLGAPTPLAWAGARSGGWGEGRWSPNAWLMDKAKAFAPASRERATFLCSCKEKVAKRKHALPPRPMRCAHWVHSASGIFRRDILVSSKNGVHPCTPPCGFFPLAPSLRKGTRQVKSQGNSKIASNSNSNSTRRAGGVCASA